jgi:hypothetical protein
MSSSIVIPGLVVTTHQFELVRDAIERHAPDLPAYTRETFINPHRWNLIPDDTGRPGKAEHVILRNADRTLKANLWFTSDLRGDGYPKPHNHPWVATSEILSGGYQEHRYALLPNGVSFSVLDHQAGETNSLPLDIFHEVTKIHAPGETLTWFETGAGAQEWGYLDPDTTRTWSNRADDGTAEFLAMLDRLNPQHAGGQYA